MADLQERKTEADGSPAGTEAPSLAAAAGDKTVVAFEHRFFKSFPEMFFYTPESQTEPVVSIKLGDNDVLLTFRGIKTEFNIEDDSADAEMMTLVTEALTFVTGLHLGDPIPKEVISREASWECTDQHRQIAHGRLTLQLATWMSGSDTLITNAEQILQLAEDPETKKKITKAFEEAAERLGLGRENGEQVVGLVDTLSEELAYIEALREKSELIGMIEEKIQTLRRLFGVERSVLAIADPVARLARTANNQFKAKFEVIDQETAEIIPVLQNIHSKIESIRSARDDLYRRLIAWEDMFQNWSICQLERSENNVDLLRDTYRFLASRFLQASEWKLVTKALDASEEKSKAGRKTRVIVREEKPLTGARRW